MIDTKSSFKRPQISLHLYVYLDWRFTYKKYLESNQITQIVIFLIHMYGNHNKTILIAKKLLGGALDFHTCSMWVHKMCIICDYGLQNVARVFFFLAM